MDLPTYANVTSVARAGDIAITPAATLDIMAALQQASRGAETMVGGRIFYPVTETRTLDFPTPSGRGAGTELWLDNDELAALPTAVTVGGTAYTDYEARPESGPPYRWLEPNQAATVLSFGTSTDWQNAITITGQFGALDATDDTAVATTSSSIGSTTQVLPLAQAAPAIGIGDLLRVDTERMIVTATRWADTTDTLAADVSASNADTAVAVADGTLYTAGETLLIGTERMVVQEVAGDTLVLARRADGTQAAVHPTGATIYAVRSLTVTRAALGTTAATHSSGAAVARHRFDPVVAELVRAEALVTLAQQGARYARTIGSSENEREARHGGLRDLRQRHLDRWLPTGQVVAAGGVGTGGRWGRGALWPLTS